MSKKIIFLQAIDMDHEQMKILSQILHDRVSEYSFILTDKEIKPVDKDEILRVLQNEP
ncbi:hypothetical protein [Nitrosopumilus sp.]|uniref:hypothetical protein n=1 Tax=Nitrosopumilus sp. TaxID=2024843 RepID=UPI003D14745A